MGYSPNRPARQLCRQKSDIIGLILAAGARHFVEPFFTEFITGLGNELSSRTYDLLASAEASDNDFIAATALRPLSDELVEQGFPDRIRLDRDPLWVGS
jgi:DNA-binding LacI/PurR family transcriptional regulator